MDWTVVAVPFVLKFIRHLLDECWAVGTPLPRLVEISTVVVKKMGILQSVLASQLKQFAGYF